MPLPEKVIEQLSKEPIETPGWSIGLLTFSGGLFGLVLLIWLGLVFGYEPYIDKLITAQSDQINQLSQTISPTDQTNLVNFYSQISNLKTLLKNHEFTMQLFNWLEKNTEANVYYQSLDFSQGNQLTLFITAASEGDINQQIAIYENSSDVENVVISAISSPTANTGWQVQVTLTLNPLLFTQSSS